MMTDERTDRGGFGGSHRILLERGSPAQNGLWSRDSLRCPKKSSLFAIFFGFLGVRGSVTQVTGVSLYGIVSAETLSGFACAVSSACVRAVNRSR